MEENIVMAIDYINDNILFGSNIKYIEVLNLFEKYNLEFNERTKIIDELKELEVNIVDEPSFNCKIKKLLDYIDKDTIKKSDLNNWANLNYITLNYDDISKAISILGCDIIDENTNLENAIDYIDDNITYASELDYEQVEKICENFNLNIDEKAIIIDELNSLEIKIIYNKTTKNTEINESEHEELTKDCDEIYDDIEMFFTKEDQENDNFSNNNEYDFLDELEDENLDDILDSESFMKQVNKLKVEINKTHNEKYIVASKSQDEIVRNKGLNDIVVANTKLVWKNALRFQKFATVGFTVDDMFQEGVIGMLKAAEKFDLSLGLQFSTYATWWINQAIIRGIANYSTSIRFPVHMRERIIKLIKVENLLFEELGRVPTDDEISARLGESTKNIKELRSYIHLSNLDTLDKLVGEDQSAYLGDFIQDDTSSTETIVENNLLKQYIDEYLSLLKSKEQYILTLRFGLDNENEHTLQDIGEKLNVTRERIRQIEAKSLRKLRNFLRNKKLTDFIN